MTAQFSGKISINCQSHSGYIRDLTLDYQRISIEPCLIGLDKEQVIQRIGQVITLCPISHQIASLTAFTHVEHPSQSVTISSEQISQLKQEWISTYAMQWMQIAQLLNMTELWAPVVRLLLTGQHQAALKAMLNKDIQSLSGEDIQSLFESNQFEPNSQIYAIWNWTQSYDWHLSEAKYQQIAMLLAHGQLGDKAITHNTLWSLFEIKLQQLITLILDEENTAKLLLESSGFEKITYHVMGDIGKAEVRAPRGTLFHQVECDDAGKVIRYQIKTPTDTLCSEESSGELSEESKEAQSVTLKSFLSDCPLPKQNPLLGIKVLLALIDPCVPVEMALECESSD
ncbi:MAG: hypothetical protein ACK5NC_15815 [Vibrio sp.]